MREFSYSFTITPKPMTGFSLGDKEITRDLDGFVSGHGPTLQEMLNAQAALSHLPQAITDFSGYLTHRFAHDVYAREMHIPRDMYIISKIHRKSNITVLLDGELWIASPRGIQIVRSGEVFVTPPGTKRILWAKKESRLMTVHGTNLTDISRLEDDLTINESKTLEKAA